MFYYYLTCRSLTYAQRSSKVLEMAGIKNTVIRIPQGLSKEGCGYALKINQGVLNRSIAELVKHKLQPKRVFEVRGDGEFVEVNF